MLSYKDCLRRVEDNALKAQEHLERHRPLITLANQIGPLWSPSELWGSDRDERGRAWRSDWDPDHMMSSLGGVLLNLHLGPNDTVAKDVALFIEDHFMGRPDLEFRSTDDYITKGGWVGWRFVAKDVYAVLRVRAWFGEATSCQVIGTGQFEEKMKLVCAE